MFCQANGEKNNPITSDHWAPLCRPGLPMESARQSWSDPLIERPRFEEGSWYHQPHMAWRFLLNPGTQGYSSVPMLKIRQDKCADLSPYLLVPSGLWTSSWGDGHPIHGKRQHNELFDSLLSLFHNERCTFTLYSVCWLGKDPRREPLPKTNDQERKLLCWGFQTRVGQ